MIFVTHDQSSHDPGDRIAVMDHGRIQQAAPPWRSTEPGNTSWPDHRQPPEQPVKGTFWTGSAGFPEARCRLRGFPTASAWWG
jgi:ABC-type sugar transport system ATPase subunit